LTQPWCPSSPSLALIPLLWPLLVAWGLARGDALPVEQIAPGIYLHRGAQEVASHHNRGHIANLGFVVGTDRVAVIDTGGSLEEGLALRAAVRQATDKPIAYVILTHVHPDHILGAAAFAGDRAEVIGHANLPDALARRGAFYLERATADLGELMAGTRVVAPSSTVSGTRALELGGRTIELRAHPTAHTNNDLSIWDPQTKTLWLSDLLFVGRTPVIDGSLLGWLKVLADLEQAPAERAVPGHGPVPEDWRGAVADERRYLESVADGVRAVIRRRGTLEEAVQTVSPADPAHWLLLGDYHRRNVTAAFVELEWE
jgi:quinoprotein relay system zinc metallohydrolase 2